MAPIKTYGKKKINKLTTTEQRKMKQKSLQNSRRPLATLQSANVKLVKEVVNKAKQNTISTRTVAVSHDTMRSSPSFPGSVELSSIWNSDSTFDKLRQTSPKPQPVVKEADIKTSSSYNAIATSQSTSSETPVLSTRSKSYGLRSHVMLNKRPNKLGLSSSNLCLGCCNNSSYSQSLSNKDCQQLSSTPNVGNSIRPDITELTPIYPEILQADSLIPNETFPLVNVQEDISQPELVAGKSPQKSEHSIPVCKVMASPDMFSSPEASPVISISMKKCNAKHACKQPPSQGSTSECLSNCGKGIHNSSSVMLLKTSEIPAVENNSGNTKLNDNDYSCAFSVDTRARVDIRNYEKDVSNSSFSNVDSFQLNSLEPQKASRAVDAEISSESDVSDDFMMRKSSMTENACDGLSCSQQDEEMADSRQSADFLTRFSPITSNCKNSVSGVNVELGNDEDEAATTSFYSLQEKSLEPGSVSQIVDATTSFSSNVADSLHRLDAKVRLSPIASDSENSVSLASNAEASPVLEYVNLRNRKVRWHDHSSLKNDSGLRSLSKIVETNSIEGEVELEQACQEVVSKQLSPTSSPSAAIDEVPVIGNEPETVTESKTSTESEQQVVADKLAPTLRPSAAFGRRKSIWLSSKARAASRRFSVAPGKVLAKPRPTSLGFRGLHGILAPSLAEQADFFDKLGDTINNLSTVSIAATPPKAAPPSIVATPQTQLDISIKITARDVVLQKCDQDEPLPFDDAFPEAYLSKCRKIGEGLYGEVFMWEAGSQSSVIKVIPIAGDELINGERQKTYDEILSEIIITKELSDLRHTELVTDHSDNLTSGFVEVKRTACVRGKYPQRMLQLWEEFAEHSGTENDNPAVFSVDQVFIVLELANGGADLEKFKFNNSSQALSIFLQTAYALAAAERRIEFEHRDLHWGNVLVSKTDVRHLEIVMNGTLHKVPTNGVQVSIIDFTLSRMTYDGLCIYNDLSQDDSLFVSEGDYQFDIYRMMKENCRNDWREFVPANNVLWLHYIVDKMIAGVHYRKTDTKVHRENLKKLVSFKRSLLNFSSSIDFVESLS